MANLRRPHRARLTTWFVAVLILVELTVVLLVSWALTDTYFRTKADPYSSTCTDDNPYAPYNSVCTEPQGSSCNLSFAICSPVPNTPGTFNPGGYTPILG